MKEEDSDEGLGGVFAKDPSTGLSYEKMIYMKDMNHPREIHHDIEKETINFIKHPIFGTRTGWNHCNKSWRKSDLN